MHRDPVSERAYSIEKQARNVQGTLTSTFRRGLIEDESCRGHSLTMRALSIVIVWRGLTDVKRRGVVGVAGAGVSRLEDEAGNAGVLDDVTPTRIGDIVGGTQHGRRWVPITVCPVPDPLPLPGATIGAGHATWTTRLHLRQTRLPLAATNRRAVCVLYKQKSYAESLAAALQSFHEVRAVDRVFFSIFIVCITST